MACSLAYVLRFVTAASAFSSQYVMPNLAEHRRRGGEMLLGLLAHVRAAVELAEAEMAVGDEEAAASGVGPCSHDRFRTV